MNINNINVMKLFANGTDVSTSLAVGARLSEIQSSLADLRRHFGGQRGILQRLNRLENRTSSALSGTVPLDNRLQNIFLRIMRLESRVDRIVSKLTEDNCESMPCQNGGTCIDIYDGFVCKCPDNWMGSACTEDVNECAIFIGTDLGCQNGASCLNTAGGYR